jgi:hypothetical protein
MKTIALKKLSPKKWLMRSDGNASELTFPYGAKDLEVIASVRNDNQNARLFLSTGVKVTKDISALINGLVSW